MTSRRETWNDADAAAPSPHRRDLLKAGLAVSALPAVVAWPAAGLAAAPSFYKLVYDRDHPVAVDFGRNAEAAGQPTYAIGGDVTALWYDDLYHRWRQGPAAIAGLTSVSVAMVLEMMAWDAGLRTAFRAEHTPTAAGGMRHALTGPEPMLAHASLLDTGAAWGVGASKLLSRYPAAGSARSTLTLDCAPAPGVAHAEPLVSWVFAPVARA
jgi:hypothetical protein